MIYIAKLGKNNVVDEIRIIDTNESKLPDQYSDWVIAESSWAVGGVVDKNNNYTPPVIKQIVPQSISRRQFFQQAAVKNISGISIITEKEAIDGMKGNLPATLQNMVNSLPEENRFAAESLLVGAQDFERNNKATILVATALGMDSQQIDQYFIDASKL